MSATEVTDYFSERRKTLVSRVENSKNVQICLNLDGCFSSVGNTLLHMWGKFSSNSISVSGVVG